MPRANRYIVPGYVYHVTHRCHNRDFLFRYAVARNRYRMLVYRHLKDYDISRLLDLLGGWPRDRFQIAYRDAIQEAINRRDLQRQAKWSESIAVGSEAFIKRVGPRIRNRMQIEIQEDPADPTTLLIREAQFSYSPKTHPRN